MSDELIKVAIADDHKIFRDGIKMALKDKEYLKILWEAEDGKDLMHKLRIKQPDVLLMDIRMPEIDGINAIPLLRKEYEEVKIIVLTMYDDQEMITKMMEMGANAYLTKTTDPGAGEEVKHHALQPVQHHEVHGEDAEQDDAEHGRDQVQRQLRQVALQHHRWVHHEEERHEVDDGADLHRFDAGRDHRGLRDRRCRHGTSAG